MTDHFTLRVYPERLREGARKLTNLADHLEGKGGDLSKTPDQIGDDWTGDAATAIKAEMTALGGHVSDFAPKLRTAASALSSLAGDYETALEDIANLNTKWEATETAYDSAVTRADNARRDNLDAARGPDNRPVNRADRDEIDRIRRNAVDDAADTRRTDQRNLNQSYSLTKQWLAHQTGEAGRTIDDSLVIKLTPEQLAEYQSTGVVPMGLDRSALADLALANQKREEELVELASTEAAGDVEQLEELLGDDPTYLEDPAALRTLLESMGGKADDPYYAKALVDLLGTDGVNTLYNRIDTHLSRVFGDTEEVPDDWAESLGAFNDVLAAGVSQYSDPDLVTFASGLSGHPDGSPPRFGMMLGSDYADSRLQVIGLAWLERMNNSKYPPGNPTPDVAERLLQSRYGGFEGMAEDWASDIDPDQVALFLNTLDPDTSQSIAEGLISDGWNDYDDGPFHQDTWRIKEQVWADVLAQAVEEKYPFAASALLHSVHEGLNTPLMDELLDKIAPHFENPEFISLLASNHGTFDHEEVARLVDQLGDRVDINEVISELIASRGDTSDRGIAAEVGYLLGLLDVTGTEIDYGPVFVEVLDSAVGKAIEKVPVGSEIYGVLKALMEAGAKANETYENWGKGWTEEAQHQVLAWTIYVGEHGEPPGFADWVAENPHRLNAAEPNAAIEQYLSDLKLSDDPVDQEAWERIDTLKDVIEGGRNKGDG